MCYKSFNLQSELNIHTRPYICDVCHELGIRVVWSYTSARIVENVHMPLMFVINHWRCRVIWMYINSHILENIVPVMCVISHSGCCIIWRHISEYIENIFAEQGNLQVHQHRLIHSRKCSYTCIMSNKSLRKQGDLRRHNCIHSRKHPYNWDMCNKSFREQGYLKGHEYIHCGEHPYKWC